MIQTKIRTIPGRPRLSEFILQIVDEMESPDPHVIAREVRRRCTPEMFEEIVSAALPDLIRNTLRVYYRSVRMQHHREPSQMNGSEPSSVSTNKRVRLKTWYQQMLHEPVYVVDTWKLLKKCTATDLFLVADAREVLAEQTHNQAIRWRRLATYLNEHELDTVEHVPEDELRTLLEES